MKLSKYSRPIPNRKITNESPANSIVTHYYMEPAEIIRLYGPPNSPLRKRFVR